VQSGVSGGEPNPPLRRRPSSGDFHHDPQDACPEPPQIPFRHRRPRHRRRARPARARPAPLTVGFIYVGPRDDFGYNQAHAEGAAAVKAMAGVTVVEEENVAETIDVQKSMESMINLDGVSLIFPTSFGYFNPHILELAPKYPDVRFQHAAGLWNDSDARQHRQLFRLYRHGPVPERHRRRAHEPDQEDRLRRGQANPAGAAQHQLLPPRGPRRWTRRSPAR
jgi:hypothetical protein